MGMFESRLSKFKATPTLPIHRGHITKYETCEYMIMCGILFVFVFSFGKLCILHLKTYIITTSSDLNI